MSLSREQKIARQNAIGMSQWAAILGIDDFQSVGNVAREKLTGISSFKGNKYAEFGSLCEPVVAHFFDKYYLPHLHPGTRLLTGAEAADELLKRYPHIEVAAEGNDGSISFRHKEVWWYVCTPDRILSDFSRIVEIKWVSVNSFKSKWQTHEIGSPQVPKGYHIQVLGQQHFFNGIAAYLLAGFGGNSIRAFDIKYRQHVAEKAFNDVQAFVDKLVYASENNHWFPEWIEKPQITLRDPHPLPVNEIHAKQLVTRI